MNKRKRPEHRGVTFNMSSISHSVENRHRKPPKEKESAPEVLDPPIKPKQKQCANLSYANFRIPARPAIVSKACTHRTAGGNTVRKFVKSRKKKR